MVLFSVVALQTEEWARINYITNKQQYVIICKVHYSFLFLPKLCFRRTLATYYENNSNVKIDD